MNQIMKKLERMEEREYSTLVRVLFGLETSTPVSQELEEVQFLDPTLNDSQRDAIRFALASREVALIHGPPGVSRNHPSDRPEDSSSLDWQNIHTHRAHSTANPPQAPHSCLRPFQHLRRQHRRTASSPQTANHTVRTSSAPSSIGAQSFFRRIDTDLGSGWYRQRCEERDGCETSEY